MHVIKHVGRSWAYRICPIAVFVVVLVFITGTRPYSYIKNSKESPIIHVVQVLWVAVMKRKQAPPMNIDALYEDCSGTARILHTNQFRYQKKFIWAEGER